MPLSVTVRLPTMEDLEAYAQEQWEVATLALGFVKLFFTMYV